jgi:acyl-CoA reductase-like NAD-dependent aldehyde dehydrogenase
VIEVLSSYVNGFWTPGGDVGVDENPARIGEHVAQVAHGDPALAGRAITAAAAAGRAWAAMPAPERAGILRRTADILGERRSQIGADLVAEEGKTLPEALGETDRAAAILRYYAGQALEPARDDARERADRSVVRLLARSVARMPIEEVLHGREEDDKARSCRATPRGRRRAGGSS